MTELLMTIQEQRMSVTLNRILVNRKEYKDQREIENDLWQNLLKTELSKKQLQAINKYLDAQSYLSGQYGEVAYELGLRDGINLVKEIRELEELPFK